MADNALTVVAADETTKTLRSADVGSGVQAQMVNVGPWVPTTVDSAQYSLDVGGTVVTLTVPSTATHVLITIEDADVRFTENGDTPTTGAAGNGLVLPAGFIGELVVPVGESLKFIGISGTAEMNCTYRKYV